MTTPDRAARLQAIAEEIEGLAESPLYDYRREHGFQPVPGEGDPHTDVVLIGEAPGKKEAQTGRPFVGQAGRILDELLDSIDLRREEVYITNVVKDRPPGNRDPTKEEIALYAPFLARQLQVIRPRVIVTLGRFAMNFILRRFDLPQQGKRIGDLHGQVLPAEAAYGPVVVVPLYHPAAALYNPNLRETLREDMQTLQDVLDEEQRPP